MKRSRFTSDEWNWRYPDVDLAGSMSPWLSRNLTFETVTSGNSSLRRLMTSPIVSAGPSAIAVRDDQMELSNEQTITRFQRCGIQAVDR